MSLFGEHLRSIIEGNKINVYALSKRAGLDRSAIHKIMSGSKIPVEDYAQKLAAALPLSPAERTRFLEAYTISSVGEQRYKQRKQVKELIESIAQIEKGFNAGVVGAWGSIARLEEADTVVTGSFAVNNLVKNAIAESLFCENGAGIDFVIPDSYQYFYNELLSCYAQNPQAQIRHIITFAKKIDALDGHNTNIQQIANILPLAFASDTGYQPYYFYRSSPDLELTQTMPYFILTSTDKLILINRKLDRAALMCNKDFVQIYKDSFTQMLEQSKPLISTYENVHEVLAFHANAIHKDDDEPVHVINPEPSVEPVFTKEMLDKLIKRDIPDREELIEMVYKHYGIWRENKNPYIEVCATNGAYDLIHSGYFFFAPHDLFEPIPKDMMADIMSKMQAKINVKKLTLLFTDPSKILLPKKTFIAVSRKSGVIIFTSKGETNCPTDFICICLNEDSITEAVLDFVESIEQSGLVYSAEESAKTLESIIGSM